MWHAPTVSMATSSKMEHVVRAQPKTCFACSAPQMELIANFAAIHSHSSMDYASAQLLAQSQEDQFGLWVPHPQATATIQTTPQILATSLLFPMGPKLPPIYDRYGCSQIQVFAQGKCLQVINYWISYQPDGLCQFCAQGYLFTIFGDCTINNRILACDPGFWLNRKYDVCVKVSPACDWYNPLNGSCINCSRGYYWVNQSCVQNLTCNSRQFFFEGVCIDVPSACTAFTLTGACTRCIQGYNLNGTICTTDPNRILDGNTCNFPCKTCHEFNKGYCFSCVIFYQLEGAKYGTCIPVVTWSQTFISLINITKQSN